MNFPVVLSVVLGLCLPGLSLATAPAPPARQVVLLQSMPVLPVLQQSQAIVERLAELGYRDGDQLALTVLPAEGDPARAEALLRQRLETGPVELVLTSATLASLAARDLLRERGIPQIFFTVSDPVGAGLVPRLDAPSGQLLTGRVHSIPRAVKIKLVLEVLRTRQNSAFPPRFGFIHCRYPSAIGDAELLAQAARDLGGVKFIRYSVPYHPLPEGLPEMLEGVRRGIKALEPMVDFWWAPSGPLGEREEYTRLLRDHSARPLVFGTNAASVRLGALLNIAPNDADTGREVAEMAVAVLAGADPARMPVTTPRHFDLVLNLATAREMGVVFGSDLLELAGPHLFLEQAP